MLTLFVLLFFFAKLKKPYSDNVQKFKKGKQKNPICDKTQIVTKQKHLNCDKTKNFKLGQLKW